MKSKKTKYCKNFEGGACVASSNPQSLDSFYFVGGKANPSLRRTDCVGCFSAKVHKRYVENPEKMKTNSLKWYYSNKEHCRVRGRERHLMKAYGVTTSDYDQMLKSQNGECLLCGVHYTELKHYPSVLVVDHDHKTGSVRGLLCAPCNSILGVFNDDPKTILRAVSHLVGKNNVKTKRTKRYGISENRSGNRNRKLKQKYGISLDGYNAMLTSQNGKCNICTIHYTELKCFPKNLVVDHDHKTGKIRGLLCALCNRTLGLLNDDPKILRRIVKYLKGELTHALHR